MLNTSRKGFLWIASMIIALALGSYFANQLIEKDEFSNEPVEGIPEELINTEKEAVEFAKQDANISSFANKFSWTDYYTRYDREPGIWTFVIYVVNANDLDYQISFYPNGTIIFKGPIPL